MSTVLFQGTHTLYIARLVIKFTNGLEVDNYGGYLLISMIGSQSNQVSWVALVIINVVEDWAISSVRIVNVGRLHL